MMIRSLHLDLWFSVPEFLYPRYPLFFILPEITVFCCLTVSFSPLINAKKHLYLHSVFLSHTRQVYFLPHNTSAKHFFAFIFKPLLCTLMHINLLTVFFFTAFMGTLLRFLASYQTRRKTCSVTHTPVPLSRLWRAGIGRQL